MCADTEETQLQAFLQRGKCIALQLYHLGMSGRDLVRTRGRPCSDALLFGKSRQTGPVLEKVVRGSE